MMRQVIAYILMGMLVCGCSTQSNNSTQVGVPALTAQAPPTLQPPSIELVRSLSSQGRYEEAASQAHKLLRLWKAQNRSVTDVTKCRVLLAACYYKAKNYEKALEQYDCIISANHHTKAIVQTRDEVKRIRNQTLLAQAKSYEEQAGKCINDKNYDSAEQYAGKARDVFVKYGTYSQQTRAYWLLALSQMGKNNIHDTEYYLEQAIKTSPTSSLGHLMLTATYLADYDSSHSSTALQNAVYYSNRALTYYRNNPDPKSLCLYAGRAQLLWGNLDDGIALLRIGGASDRTDTFGQEYSWAVSKQQRLAYEDEQRRQDQLAYEQQTRFEQRRQEIEAQYQARLRQIDEQSKSEQVLILAAACSAPTTAENGSYYGQLNAYGVPKTVHVTGHYSQGTYVREHWRAAPYSNP